MKNMKSKHLALMMALILMLSTILSGCGAKTEEVEVIKLGVIGPLTGDYSMYGTAVEEGAKLAAKEINAAGGINGKQIEIIAYDSKGDKTEAVNAYNRLRDQDGIVGLIGGTFSGTTISIKEMLKLHWMQVIYLELVTLTPTKVQLQQYSQLRT